MWDGHLHSGICAALCPPGMLLRSVERDRRLDPEGDAPTLRRERGSAHRLLEVLVHARDRGGFVLRVRGDTDREATHVFALVPEVLQARQASPTGAVCDDFRRRRLVWHDGGASRPARIRFLHLGTGSTEVDEREHAGDLVPLARACLAGVWLVSHQV